jgi:hypothetical protein
MGSLEVEVRKMGWVCFGVLWHLMLLTVDFCLETQTSPHSTSPLTVLQIFMNYSSATPIPGLEVPRLLVASAFPERKLTVSSQHHFDYYSNSP